MSARTREPCSSAARAARASTPLLVGVRAARAVAGRWSSAFDVPHVPGAVAAASWRRRWSPTAALLFGALLRHAEDHAAARSPARRVLGRADRVAVRAEPRDRDRLFPYAVLLQVTPIVAIAPLIIIWVKDPTAVAGDLRHARGAVPDHLQHDARPAQRRTRACIDLFRLNRATRWQTLRAAAHPERAALLLRRAAHRERPGADRRGGRRVRRRHRRHRPRAWPTRSCWPASSSTSRACSPRWC